MAADFGTTSSAGDAIAILMNDHLRIKALFDQLVDGDGSTRPGLLAELKPLLVVHNAGEENVVYPAIFGIAMRPHHAKGLYHQQDDATVAFWELQQMDPGDPEFLRKAADLRDALLAHVRHEEESEFPELRQTLTPEALAKLTAELMQFRETFGGAVIR